MQYFVYDVFTDVAFGGNPLAVVLDAGALTGEQMQTIAREFGFSETTFVLPPRTEGTDAHVRIFTPTLEMQFAGHPTVGTALALFEAGHAGSEMVLELGVGPIPVSINEGRARFVTKVPLAISAAPTPAQIAACTGLELTDVRTDRHAPVTAGLGTDFVLAELRDQATLSKAAPVIQCFQDVAGPNAECMGLMVYCRDAQRINARMFAPLGGIIEDPATGSAAAALAGYLGQLDGQSATFEITQGVDMGRPSQIGAEVTVEGGEPVVVAIAGSAVKVMEGRLSLAPGLA